MFHLHSLPDECGAGKLQFSFMRFCDFSRTKSRRIFVCDFTRDCLTLLSHPIGERARLPRIFVPESFFVSKDSASVSQMQSLHFPNSVVSIGDDFLFELVHAVDDNCETLSIWSFKNFNIKNGNAMCLNMNTLLFFAHGSIFTRFRVRRTSFVSFIGRIRLFCTASTTMWKSTCPM
jgi:hypothetical protein